MVSDILLTLKSLHYSGDHKNFNFDKYCTAHVEQHNCLAALAKYGVAPLEETMKIHYFKDVISDSSFASVKSTIMVNCQKFQEFDAVMQLYVNHKRTQMAEAPTHQAHNISALQGCGGCRQGRGGRGRGRQGGLDGCLKGIVPQEEVDKVITAEAKFYPYSEYSKFTPAKKQKHYQLMKKTNKTSKGSATLAELTSAICAVSAAASAISELTAMTNKRTALEDGETNDNEVATDSE
jgi:hypothetical protein